MLKLNMLENLALPLKLSVIALSMIALLPISAHADQNLGCDGSTAEMQECIGTQFSIADKELTTVYANHLAKLTTLSRSSDPTTKSDAVETERRLISAQKTWLAFRDAECQLQGTDMLGGSGEGLVIYSCLLSMTQERLGTLKNYAF